MIKSRIIASLLLIIGLSLGFFIFFSETEDESSFPFKLGLDLRGGTHLVYEADLRDISYLDRDDSLNSLRDVIERRVNIFGVSEPIIQIEKKGSGQEAEGRLVVELPGVTDVDEAIALIGATPVLDFRVEKTDAEIDAILEGQEIDLQNQTNIDNLFDPDQVYVKTELTGRFLKRAQLQFDNLTGEPNIVIYFNDEGSILFEEITGNNIGKTVAIYLDGSLISNPVVQQKIDGGTAQITGNFTPLEAKTLVGRLNQGALPIPITLLSTQNIGSSLGTEAVEDGVRSGIIGLILVSLFFIFWYRLLGIYSVLSLSLYLIIMLSLFKLIPVTLTAAGVAGFILSIGLAVDANVLIFERVKEELKKNNDIREAIEEGFSRAWLSIRDANLSSIFTAIILFWFGTSLIKGFALTFGIGTVVSMGSAIIATKTFILSFNYKKKGFILSSGIKR